MRAQWADSWEDYYEILQVHFSAESEVIRAAYVRLAQKYHPDRNKSPNANARMKEINEAYEVLGDPLRRAQYDEEFRKRAAFASSRYSDVHNGGGGTTDSGNAADRAGSEAGTSAGGGSGDPTSGSYSTGSWKQPRTPYASVYCEEGILDVHANDRGVFSYRSWPWELAGLIVTMMTGGCLIMLAFAGNSLGIAGPFLLGTVMLTSSFFSAYRTTWLTVVRSEPTPVKVLAGACVVVGWISLAIIAFYVFVVTALVVATLMVATGLLLRSLLGRR